MKIQKHTPFVPYKKTNNTYAVYNRFHPTTAEKKIREKILKNKLLGYKFTRQKPLEAYIADFYCAKLMLVIEIDGDSHIGRGEYDAIRESKLAEYGIEIIRYQNDKVLENIDYVKTHLKEYILERQKKIIH